MKSNNGWDYLIHNIVLSMKCSLNTKLYYQNRKGRVYRMFLNNMRIFKKVILGYILRKQLHMKTEVLISLLQGTEV